jgi:Protein of unknown function (DUF1353)
MSGFTSKLVAEQVEDVSQEGRGTWKLLYPLTYESDLLNDTLIVPTGFVTDFASVPRIPIIFDLLGDRGNLAATLHDWLYTLPHPINDRKKVDDILKEALIAQGVNRFAAWAIYIGVRIGGKSHFDS